MEQDFLENLYVRRRCGYSGSAPCSNRTLTESSGPHPAVAAENSAVRPRRVLPFTLAPLSRSSRSVFERFRRSTWLHAQLESGDVPSGPRPSTSAPWANRSRTISSWAFSAALNNGGHPSASFAWIRAGAARSDRPSSARSPRYSATKGSHTCPVASSASTTSGSICGSCTAWCSACAMSTGVIPDPCASMTFTICVLARKAASCRGVHP